jgi:hypothetical protein
MLSRVQSDPLRPCFIWLRPPCSSSLHSSFLCFVTCRARLHAQAQHRARFVSLSCFALLRSTKPRCATSSTRCATAASTTSRTTIWASRTTVRCFVEPPASARAFLPVLGACFTGRIDCSARCCRPCCLLDIITALLCHSAPANLLLLMQI